MSSASAYSHLASCCHLMASKLHLPRNLDIKKAAAVLSNKILSQGFLSLKASSSSFALFTKNSSSSFWREICTVKATQIVPVFVGKGHLHTPTSLRCTVSPHHELQTWTELLPPRSKSPKSKVLLSQTYTSFTFMT